MSCCWRKPPPPLPARMSPVGRAGPGRRDSSRAPSARPRAAPRPARRRRYSALPLQQPRTPRRLLPPRPVPLRLRRQQRRSPGPSPGPSRRRHALFHPFPLRPLRAPSRPASHRCRAPSRQSWLLRQANPAAHRRHGHSPCPASRLPPGRRPRLPLSRRRLRPAARRAFRPRLSLHLHLPRTQRRQRPVLLRFRRR